MPASSFPSGSPPPEPPRGPRRRRRWWLAAAALLALAAALAHGWWWYAPRLHPAVPDPDDVPGRLLAEGALPVALWLPHPHQNLGVLERGIGRDADRRRFLAATARLAALPEPAIPRFGPFPAPPARELVALSDEAGERVLVAARVYPGLARLARLAGWLAGNPWLAGGDVRAFGGDAEVRWEGTLWTVGTVPLEAVLDPPAGAAEVDREVAAGEARAAASPGDLAALRLDAPVAFLPAGTFRLRHDPGGLTIAGDAAPPAELVALLAAVPLGHGGPALLAVSGPGGPLERSGVEAGEPPLPEAGSGLGRGALALLPGGLGGGDLLAHLPGAAVWYRAGGARFRLPAEGLLSRAQPEAPVPGADGGGGEGWARVATSPATLEAADALTPAVDRLAATAALALVADPAPALEAVDAVTGVLRLVPLTSREEVRRWEDWRTVLSPLAGFRRITVLAGAPGDDGGLWVRLGEAAADPPR